MEKRGRIKKGHVCREGFVGLEVIGCIYTYVTKSFLIKTFWVWVGNKLNVH